jgi:hypothetical protein
MTGGVCAAATTTPAPDESGVSGDEPTPFRIATGSESAISKGDAARGIRDCW